MRSIFELLGDLRGKGIALSLDGETLKCSAPQGALTGDLRNELRERKPEIVAFLRASRQTSTVRSPIPRVDRSRPLPLSYGQQRLWFLTQLDPTSPVYNIGLPLRMKGPLNIPALELAFKKIVERHEDLRTSFVAVDGEPRAVIGSGKDWNVKIVDARGLGDGPGSALYECAAQQSREPIDIARGPLFRVSLLLVEPDHHLLIISVHHIACDGWSIGVLAGEFAELYQAYAETREPHLAPLSIQYVDFAAWQRQWLDSGELNRQLEYWTKQLAGAPPVIAFPHDGPRNSLETARGSRMKLVIPRNLTASLERLSSAQNVTLFMTLLAAFDVLLARYTGQEDIVIGSPSAGRNRAELNPLVGFFVNNLVLRTDLSGNPTFAELLGRVREITLRAYEHQDVPFDRLVHALRPERTLNISPLFQVMFALQNFPVDEVELAGVKTTPVEMPIETARFDLTVEVFPKKGELWAYFDYNSDLYQAETMARIQRHYLAVLDAVCTNPEQRIGSISLLDGEDRERLRIEARRTEALIPDLCFHEQFERHARETPDRTAVVDRKRSLTYAELDRRSGRIAARLKALGAGPDKLVALCLERSVDLVAGMLGVARSGAAYVPIDPAYPAGRIQNIFEDAQPLSVVTERHLLSLLPTGAKAICLDDLDSTPANDSEGLNSGSNARAQNLAYVIFTSGSTGRPKGVEIPHHALTNFLKSMQKEPGLASDDVLLAVTTPSFDIAALELLLPLYVGATVAVAATPADPAALLDDLGRFRPTVMQATPATWKLLIASGWKGDPNLKILCGGEALEAGLARSLHVRSASLWNMYGPTETTIWSAALKIEGANGDAIPVGPPIPNTSFYVLDRWNQPVPEGVSGELWIGGEGLARGYLNRPDLTAERFASDPFSGKTGARMYRTGDQVRRRADGTLDFFGRLDQQVKFRGFRIELGEIEAALRNAPGVQDAVVLLRQDDGNARLVGYLISSGDGPSSVSEIRESIRACLPHYMVPGAFLFLEAFPRLPNGKLNRAALPAPEVSQADSSAQFAAPATGLQESIAATFRKVLGVERVSLDDNFFDLGAHSLQIVKIHGDLNGDIGGSVPLVAFFQYPSIRLLAEFIEKSREMEACGVEK